MNHFNLTLAAEEPDIISIAVRPGVIGVISSVSRMRRVV